MFDNKYLKNSFIYIVLMHIITFVSTSVFVLIFPKIYSVSDYGYYQTYLLYSGYIGVLHFGYFDGLYLRLVGKKYDEIDISNIKSNFIVQIIIQNLIAIIFIFSILFKNNFEFNLFSDKTISILFVVISIPFVNLKTFFQYILQSTGRIKEYSIIQVFDRISLIIIVLLLYCFNNTYLSLVFGDLLSKIFLFFLSFFYCKNIVINNEQFVFNFKDFKINLNIGFKIMIANLCGSLLFGISKFFVNETFDIETFSIFSLSLTFTNLVVSIFGSVGVVLLPYIKNKDHSFNKNIYINLHFLVSLVIFFFMIFYLPVSVILSKWLPNYYESFKLMSILFPILYIECQFNFLDSTYIKSYRLEKNLMINYLFSTIFIFILSLISTIVFNDLYLTSFFVLGSYIIRTFLCQLDLINTFNISNKLFIVDTIVIPICFVVSNFIIKNIVGMIVYIIIYFIYIFVFRNYFIEMLKFINNNINIKQFFIMSFKNK